MQTCISKSSPIRRAFELKKVLSCFAHNKVEPGSTQCVQNKKYELPRCSINSNSMKHYKQNTACPGKKPWLTSYFL